MVGTQQVKEQNDMQGNNNKDKAIIRLNAEKHLYMTQWLLSHIYYVKVAGLNYLLSWIIKYTTQCDPQGDSIGHTASHS
jgi:hypothetical protein